MNIGEVLAFVFYFVAMLGIGVFFFVKSKSSDEKEYFLGGRGMGPWVTAMSAQASDMSGWLLMGLPGSILAFGMGKAWIGIGLALGTIANWLFVAARLRRFSKAANDSITFPQYLSNRFLASNPALQVICAVIFLVGFTLYVASAFVAGANVFTAVFQNADYSLALAIFAVIVIIYTFLGGFKAVCWTDFFQGILMLVAVLAVPIVIVMTQNLDHSALGVIEGYADKFNANPFTASWTDIASGLAWGLGYFGMPHIIVRFMSIKKASMVKKSATVAIIWVILSLGAVIIIAYLGRMLVGEELIVADKASTVFIRLSRLLFPGALGFIAGILMAAIIAASMSTADSQMLVASSAFTSDLYKPLIRKNASSKELLWVGRIVVLIVSVIAFFIALAIDGDTGNPIMTLVDHAWAIFGAAFGPTVIMSLYWKRFNFAGAIAAILSGAGVVGFWLVILPKLAGGATEGLCFTLNKIYALLPGFIVSLIVGIIVSLITKTPSEDVMDLFDKATSTNFDE